MKVTVRNDISYDINLSITFDEIKDIIEAIEMAECEGVYNKASELKAILENILDKRQWYKMKTIKISDKVFERLHDARFVFECDENKSLSYSQTIEMIIKKVPELY